jgi:hypothetical protein
MNLDSIIKKVLKEADASRYAGSYNGPLTMGEVDWADTSLGPFKHKVSKFYNAELEYDSYDGSLDSHKKDKKKLESKSKRISLYNKKHPQSNDEDGGIINQTPGKGKKVVPVNEWVELNTIPINEDLAVWFGKKKKPKGSSQPKGPWVDICRKVDGKHPPCGRSDADKGSYPKCRAAGVAGKMSDSQKRSACQQKRRAEKKDTQSGKGQKPVMTSYKTKKNESMNLKRNGITEAKLRQIIRKVIIESTEPPKGVSLNLTCRGNDGSFNQNNLTFYSSSSSIPGYKQRLSLKTSETQVPDGVVSSSKPNFFTLDVVSTEMVPKVASELSNFIDSDSGYILIGNRANRQYYCAPNIGTDQKWIDYFNSL